MANILCADTDLGRKLLSQFRAPKVGNNFTFVDSGAEARKALMKGTDFDFIIADPHSAVAILRSNPRARIGIFSDDEESQVRFFMKEQKIDTSSARFFKRDVGMKFENVVAEMEQTFMPHVAARTLPEAQIVYAL